MKKSCPLCGAEAEKIWSVGHFVRKSDKARILRFKCKSCLANFSQASFQECYRQKKRALNYKIYQLLCSGVSQRRIAMLLNISRTTVVRKFIFLALKARFENNSKIRFSISDLQFDELETFEHTKCKPLSVILAVEKDSREILDFHVSRMPAKGHLAKIALKKYGPRFDDRSRGRNLMFTRLTPQISDQAIVETDENPHYPKLIRNYLPNAIHKPTKGRRGCVTGQGELKKIVFDPLFSLNHTCAMLRANINRLFRKTWCTTKKPERLAMHIELYMHFHNQKLLQA